jgi:hypothetical protein
VDNIKLYTWLVFLLLLLSPFILQPWIEALTHRALSIEKHGRLVDAKTSAPLANAIVIFHWRKHRKDLDCVTQRAATTDADGAFALPDVSSDVSFDRSWIEGLLGAVTPVGSYGASYDYTLTVYAPGVALIDPWHPNVNPPGLAYTLVDPPAHEVGGRLQIDPIRVTHTSFAPVDEISYLARLKQELICRWLPDTEPPEVKKARALITDRIHPLPCAIPPETTLKASLIAEYLLAANDKRVTKALEPPGALLGPPSWTRDLPAGVVCRAARGE